MFSITHKNTSFRLTASKKLESSNAIPALQSKKILDQIREWKRYLHYSIRTEEFYLYWIRYFILWSGVRHPQEMGALNLRDFLTKCNPQLGQRGLF